jgi:hypothetical protein
MNSISYIGGGGGVVSRSGARVGVGEIKERGGGIFHHVLHKKAGRGEGEVCIQLPYSSLRYHTCSSIHTNTRWVSGFGKYIKYSTRLENWSVNQLKLYHPWVSQSPVVFFSLFVCVSERLWKNLNVLWQKLSIWEAIQRTKWKSWFYFAIAIYRDNLVQL